jgi:hypothetical protein
MPDADTAIRGYDALRVHADELEAEVERLRKAIRQHRDQRGDDRCWLDDLTLYMELGEGQNDEMFPLPPKCEFLKSCDRFWEQRQHDGEKIAANTSRMTIGQLEAENALLKAEVERLKAT